MSDNLLNISQAAKKLGVAAVTLRLWERQGKIKSLRTSGNQRRYSSEMLNTFQNKSQIPNPKPQYSPILLTTLISPFQKQILAWTLAVLTLAGGGAVAVKNKPLISNILHPTSYTTSSVSSGSVLAAEAITDDYRFTVNVPALFNQDLIAPNIVYGLIAGSGITFSGDAQNPTVSASGSAAFAKVKTGSTTLTATGSADLLTFVAGTGISLSADTITNKLTITNSLNLDDVGWKDDGTIVRLTTPGDIVSIGAASGAAKLNINTDEDRDLITASQSGNLKFRLTSAGIIDTGVWQGTAIANAYLANSSVTVSAGTGLSGGGSVSLGGSVTLSNSGVLSLTGTTDQVNVSASTGAITLSLPQSIATTSSPTFDGLTVSAGQISNTELANSAVTVTAGTGLSGGGAVSLGNSVTLSLPTVTTALGGTNITSYTTGDILYSSATNTLAKLGIGSTDQILVVSGGIPAWVSNLTAPSSGAFGYWTRTGTTLSPVNASDNLSLAGNASTSGTLTFTGTAAQVGTTNMRTLTLGTATTGNIVIDSGSGSIALSDNTTFSGNIDVAGSTTLNGSFTLGDAGDTGSISTSDWTINTTGDMTGIGSITANGTSTLANVNISADADLIPVTVTGTNDLGSVALPWDNLYVTNVFPQGTSGTIGWLQRNAGTLSPLNITDDFVLGSTATASALFQISGTTGAITTGVWNGTKISEVYGGTNQSSYTTGDILYASGTNTLAKRGIGSTGQVLVVSGGVPTWIDNANVGNWQRNLGAVAPINITDDVLAGGISTASATFRVDSATGLITTASVNSASIVNASVANADLANSSVTVTAGTGMSGGGAVALGSSITLTNAGVTSAIGTTNQVNVSASTGAVTFSLPQSIATNSDVTFNNLSLGGTATISGALTLYSTPTIATTAKQTLTIGDSNTGNIAFGQTITSGTWNGTKISEVYGGTNQSTYTTGDILYSSATNVLAKLGVGLAGQVLTVTAGIPSWVGASGSGSTGFWQRNLGALSPDNITDDILLGATATASAKIALNATSGLLTTTLFKLTTGAASGYALISDASGNGAWTDMATSGTAGPWTLSGSVTFPDTATYNVLIGSATAGDGISPLTVTGAETGKALVIFNETGDQDILTASASGVTKFVLDRTGTITTGIWGGTAIANANLANSSVTVTAGTGMSGGGAVSLGGTITLTNAGVTSAIGTTNQVNVSASTGAVTFSLPQSIATNSDVTFNNISLGGTATISGALTLYSTPTIATTAKQTLTLGDANTGNVIVINNLSAANLSGSNTGDQTITLSGDVSGSGTGAITTVIGALKVTNAMLAGSITAAKLVGTDITTVGALSAGSIVSGFGSISALSATLSGNLTSGGQLQLGRFLSDPTAIGSGSMYFNTTDAKLYFYNGSAWGQVGTGSGAGSNWRITDGALSPINDTLDLLVGNIASDSAKFQISATTGTASSAGNLVFNTAASIGTTAKQTLTLGDTNTGNIVIDSGSGKITLSDDITASGGLTVAGATVLNGSYTLGDNGDTGSINTSDWDITTTGDMTGIGAITFDGTLTSTASFTLNTASQTTQGAKLLSLQNASTEKFYVDKDGNLYVAGTILSGNGMGMLMTNKSGATVTNRSLVVLDTTTNSSFTTTTTAYAKTGFGVVTGVGLGVTNDANGDGICNANDICMVAVAGEVEVLLTNASTAVKGDYIFTSATAGSGVSSSKQFDGLIGVVSNTAGSASGYGKMIFKVQPQVTAAASIDIDSKHNEYWLYANKYTAVGEGADVNANLLNRGLAFDTLSDTTKIDTANTTASVTTSRAGLIGGQTLATSTTDNAGNTYLGSNTVNKTFLYERTRDSSPQVQVELGIDPNWYNGVTLSVATSSAQFSQNSVIVKNPSLSTTYNGSLVKVTGTYTSNARTIYITIKSPTTFDWTDYGGEAATGVTITPGTAQTLGGTGVSAKFSDVKYNTGDVFKIASWFVEPSGSTRGGTAKFPERSTIIATASSVDIIDADTQKLWMRFSQGTNYALGADANNDPNSVNMLNGKLYVANNGSAGALYEIDYTTSAMYRQNATNWTIADQPIAGRNTATTYNVINTSNILVNTIANDVSAAVIPNQPTQNMTVSGWGYFALSSASETVNLPYKFNGNPNIVITSAGHSSTTAPVSLASCTTASAKTVVADGITTTTFVARESALDATNFQCYSWTATGQVSPRQYVGVATDGGATVINETDGSAIVLAQGSNPDTTFDYDNVVLAQNGNLYTNRDQEAADSQVIIVYTNVAGTTTNRTGLFDYYYGTVSPINSSSNLITSLAVTNGTSTYQAGENTLYIGKQDGLSVIQEANFNYDTSITAAAGSVKYYTKDYISEEMVGDIQGMWGFNSALTDSSVKAATITAAGATISYPTGVRGKGINITVANGTATTTTIGANYSMGIWVKETTGWTHYVKTDAGTYINGVLSSSAFTSRMTWATTTVTLVAGTQDVDEMFATNTTMTPGQIKHLYQVGYRALQSHATTLGGGSADLNQQLGGTTNVVSVAEPDYNNQFMYVGTNSTTLGAVSKIDLNSDTNIKTYNSSANVPAGGALLIDEDTKSLAVGYNLEAVGSATTGVKTMGVDNNATATSGNFIGKTVTTAESFTQAYIWSQYTLDSSDASNTVTVSASNDGGSNYYTCNLTNTDTSQTPTEYEYFCQFNAAGSSLKTKFALARGSTKTNTYLTRYGIAWIGSDAMGGQAGGNGLYTNTAAAVPNGSYIDVVHNQNSNDVVSNGWVYNTNTSKWEQIDDKTAEEATGGTITYSGGYTIHTFTSSGTFTPPGTGDVEYLVVAGGGGGGSDGNTTSGTGGGGGGLLTGTLAVTSGAKTVTVGGGGAAGISGNGGGSGTYIQGVNGDNSVFDSVTATGGGGGSSYQGRVGSNGSSGGGGNYGSAGGTGIAGQGYAGGTGSTGTNRGGGGGGGASAVGANATATTGGNGGAGTSSSISGASVCYAGGGGGGVYSTGGTTGTATCGGGNGGVSGGQNAGVAGTANTGGGGGGASTTSTNVNGGAGGSGIVIVRYLTNSLSAFKIVQQDANTVRLYNYSGATQNLRLDVITGGLGRNAGTVSLAPAAADTDAQDSVNSIWINRTGLDGSILKLQKSGTDILKVSQAGGNAALILDQRLGGDIFTASASGTTKFTLSNAGAVAAVGNINSSGGSLQTNGITRIDNSGNITAAKTTTTDLAITGQASAPGSPSEGQVYFNSTDKEYYVYKNAQWTRLVADDRGSCPTGYILVPGSATFGTEDFCVMKYEAKQDADKNPVSTATGTPWVSVDWDESRAACQRDGAHLISNAEWMTIARNIESTTINDMDDDAGVQLATGHSDNAPAAAQAATAGSDPVVSGCNLSATMENAANAYSAASCEIQGDGSYAGDDNDKGFYGTSQAWSTTGYSAGAANKSQLRTAVLSNGQVIWDIPGNVWEWNDWQCGTSVWYTTGWVEWNNANVTDYEKYAAGPSGSLTSANGAGQYYGCTANRNASIRGGGWSFGADGGPFTLALDGAPSYVYTNFGFRCAK